MKQYLLSIYQPDGETPPPEFLEPIMKEVGKLMADMKSSGAWVFSDGLYPAESATVLRAKDGDVLMTDGPYIEGKEHLGGFTIVRAADLDAALEWGRRLARAVAPLAIEVRPLQGHSGHS